jgi:aspartate/methionine/tyrosine aminotransferase
MSINFEFLKPSASMEVARIAGELKKNGQTVYQLSVGDTHFSPPKTILDKLQKLPNAFSHYTNSKGIDELLPQIAKKYKSYQASDVMLVPGLKQGIYYALAALQKKRLCILEPAWLGYEATAILAEYEITSINLYSDNWKKTLLDTNFDVILLCSPNNPDGKLFSDSELDVVVEAAKKNSAWIITDFIYDKYIYSSGLTSMTTIFSYNKLIIGNGFSKSHAMTGFRIGYLLCKDKLIFERMLLIQQNLITCVSSISQYLILDFERANSEINQNAEYYRNNKNLILEIFPEWKEFEPDGGFYYFIDLSIYGIQDGSVFCENMLRNTGVALVPGSAYGRGFESYVRLSFSTDSNVLKEGLNKMKIFLNENY